MNLPLNIDVQQILLHMLNFVILFAGLYFILYSPVKKFMEDRTKVFSDMDDKAKETLKDADEIKKEYEDKLILANKEIAQLRTESIKKAESEASDIIEKAQKEAENIIEIAKNKAEIEKQEKLQNANKEVSKLAVAAVKKLVYESTEESFDAFLNSTEEGENGGE